MKTTSRSAETTAAPALPPDTRPVNDWTDPRAAPIPGYAARADGTVLGWHRVQKKWIELRPKTGPGGFRKVRLVIGGKVREIGVAHIVLRAFVGARPFGCEPYHFPDTDPANNALANLRWSPRGTSKLGRMLAPAPPPPNRGSK